MFQARLLHRLTRAAGLTLLVVAAFVAVPAGAPAPATRPSEVATLARAFLTPPDDARIMMRWWWFGPTVSKTGLERELRAMKDGGIGGVEIQPVYPVTLDDPAAGLVTHPFLSDTFLDHLGFAARTAPGLGLRIDLTLGSGWPYGGPSVAIADAAGKLRATRLPLPAGTSRLAVPDIGVGERLLAAFVVSPTVPLPLESVQQIEDVKDGVLRVAPSPEERVALFFISSRSGMMVKRAAVGSEGYVLNHYDRDALGRYLTRVGDRLLTAFPETKPAAVFCDSLEVYDSDWTPAFLDAFRTKRGYDLTPLLPALVTDAGPITTALRHDWILTLTELLNDQFIAPMQAWATAHGTKLRIQGYGVPPATLASNASVDLPEGEGYHWKTVRASRWAASIGHLYGRPVISSETWTWLRSPSFMAAPVDIKAEADLHFLQGVNQLIGHGWPYTADGAAYPGWRFYAAGAFDDRNPWWTVMPDVSRYLQRVSFLMRQGQPANDIALYLPVADARSHITPGRLPSFIDALAERVGGEVMASIIESGFNLDFVDDDVLSGAARVENKQLVIGTNRYSALVLPGVELMPPAVMGRLVSWAGQGLPIVAARRIPTLAPGYLARAADHTVVRDGARAIFPTADRVVEREADLGPRLASLVAPDVAVSSGAAAIGAIHRRTGSTDIYFLANTSNTAQSFTATFRVPASYSERWNAMTGAMSPFTLTPVQGASDRASATLALDAYESTIIVVQRGIQPGVTPVRHRAVVMPPPLDLTADWNVAIGDRPAEVWPTLRSWTDRDATKYFSGVATYRRTFELKAGAMAPGTSFVLDFGPSPAIPAGGPKARFQAWIAPPVRDAAVLFVNGQRAGTVWAPPYTLDITRWLRTGRNELRVEVANLAVNHMAGRALPDYRLLNLRYGARFEPQDMDKIAPQPSGLLGNVTLVSAPRPLQYSP